LTSTEKPFHTEGDLQLSVKNESAGKRPNGRDPLTLDRLRQGEEAFLDHIELPEDDARRLMELGFLPGTMIQAAHRSPFGDPRIFRVDGSEVALRRETAVHLFVRRNSTPSREGL
jgi:ferrous iron transport protein A